MSRRLCVAGAPPPSAFPVAVWTTAASERRECLLAKSGLDSSRDLAISTAVAGGPRLTRSPALVDESQFGCVSPTAWPPARLEARDPPDRTDSTSSSPCAAFHLFRKDAFQSSPSSADASATAASASSSEISSARAAA
eukprot:scaffold47212_cov174-Isochrysis_galbana.AAC.2